MHLRNPVTNLAAFAYRKVRSHTRSCVLLACGSIAFGAGCTPSISEDHLSPAEEACEHAVNGPAVEVSASAAPDETAGDISAEHTRFDVTLPPVDGGSAGAGWLQFNSTGGDHSFFLTRDASLVLQDGNGSAIDFEGNAVEENTCAEVVLSRTAELPVGKVFLELRTSTGFDISILVEHAGEHSDDEG